MYSSDLRTMRTFKKCFEAGALSDTEAVRLTVENLELTLKGRFSDTAGIKARGVEEPNTSWGNSMLLRLKRTYRCHGFGAIK